MEDSADIELYEELDGNPAYSSSSDTSEADPVSFQFKEPTQNECEEEEDNFARARSRPDPRMLSHAIAGKNSQDPRSCDTFVEYVGSINDNSAKLAPTSNTSIFDTIATVSFDVEPTLRTSVRDTFAILAPECGAQIGERLSSDFDRRVRSESGEVAFPFQSFPDSGESAAGRMPATVHPLSRRHVEFDRGGYVGSEFVNRSSFPLTVPMSDDAADVDRPHSAPVRLMKAMADKLDVVWSAFNRKRAMSIAGEGDAENSDTCRSGLTSCQVLSMTNNVPSVRASEDADTVVPRRTVWRLVFETESDLGPPAKPKSVVSRGDQGRNRGNIGRSVERDDEFFDASTEFDDTSRCRVARKQSRVEQCDSRIAGRSAMVPSKNYSSTDRRSRNRGEHHTGEFPNSSFCGVYSE